MQVLMPFNYAIHILACTLIVFGATSAQTLTIYHIGRPDQALPELDHSFEFVQVPWAGLDQQYHGQSHLISIQPDHLTPEHVSPETNLVPDLVRRGGGIRRLTWRSWGPIDFPLRFLTDGNTSTALLGGSTWLDFRNVFNYTDQETMAPSVVWNFDLGGIFKVHRLRFYPRLEFRFARPVQNFLIGLGEGNPTAEQTPDYNLGPCPTCETQPDVLQFKVVHRNPQNIQAHVDLALPPQVTQNVLFQAFPNTRGNWEIAEFEIYADGYAAQAQYTSNIIDLQDIGVLGDVTWSGQEPAGTHINLRVRAGNEPDPNVYWRYTFRDDEITRYDYNGRRLDRESYNQLALGEQAGTTYNTAHWTPWSSQLTQETGQNRTLDNRLYRFVQIQAELHSLPHQGPRIDYIRFSVSAPVADRLIGEIAPKAVEAGAVSPFTYTIKPTLGPTQGFDRLIVETPAHLVDVESVRLGGQTTDFTLIDLDTHRFEIAFPRIVQRRSDERLEIDFTARLFRFGTSFAGRVADHSRPYDLAQPVEPGDANPLTDNQRLQVDLLAVHVSALHSLEVSSPTLTPNGDGINDVLQIAYTLINLSIAAPLELGIYDLSGCLLHTLEHRAGTNGRFTAQWDGRDEMGNTLLTGLYILKLSLETDQGPNEQHRLISIVY